MFNFKLLFCRVFIFTILFGVSLKVKAQEVAYKSERPKIGLVLSGGGAKGLAHVGVLKVLEELDLKPDYITGVSMGAIVGGLYSIGYSAYELDSLARDIDWYSAFSDKLSYDKIGINVKDDYTKYQLKLSGNSLKDIRFPLSLMRGQIISELLSEHTWSSIGINSFDDYPIPFRCLAVDIISGKTVVFDSGSLARAIRASMAIPTAFTPIVQDNMLLVDGGVINNFPVQECIDMGADIVIGVYVSSVENATASDLNSMVMILARSATLTGVLSAKEQMKYLDIKILPDLKGAGIESFGISEEIIKMGEDAARRTDVYAKLTALSDSLKQFPEKQILKHNSPKQEISINNINVIGLKYVKKEFVVDISRIEENSTVTSGQLKKALKWLYGTLVFDKVEYRFVKNGDTYDLVFDVVEKDLINVNVGIHYDNYFRAGLLLNASYKHLLQNSSKLDLILDISKYPRAKLTYCLIGGKRKHLIFTLGTKIKNIVFPNFYEFPNSLIVSMGQFRNNQLKLYSSVSLSPTINTKLEFKTSHIRNYFQLQGGLENLYDIKNVSSNNFCLEGSFKLNTLNHPTFPTKGAKLNLNYRKILRPVASYTTAEGMFKPISDKNEIIVADYKHYLLIGNRFSVIPEFTIGFMSSIPFYADKFFLGGNVFNSGINTFNQAGVQPYKIATDNFLRTGLGFQLKLIDNWYINAFYQYALFLNNSETFSEQSLEIDGESISGWTVSIAYDSVFGPLKFTTTQNINSKKFYYCCSLGFPF